ncbi:putative DBH-like monooxygenase protein 2 [Tyto alba]|uniref:putative DBH-like monooxygenase protein 2 n=1 Tax=Tyto alba TaxID=56313 RepID=UPI001401F831|nr:putative DBH-like monooxygenase protein 2 [Tyto alba]
MHFPHESSPALPKGFLEDTVIGKPAPPLLRFSIFLDPSNTVYLRWDHDEQELMTFELQVPTTGWVAFGFSPRGELPGSDIVIGGIFPNGSIYFSDCHMVDEATLEEDESQDYQLLSVTENETSTTMLFKRHLRTCDPNDLDITTDTARLIVAFGTDDTVQFFKGQRFSKSLFLMRYRGPSDLNDPKIFFTYDLRLDNFAVPIEETKYACTFLPLPVVKQKHHIYKFEPIITPHNITLVHHILVYACGNVSVLPRGIDDCYGANPDFALCSQVLVGWAVGGESYQLPDEAAFSIGTPWDPRYIRLEIHYSNFDLLPGLIDSSGIRIYYTPELRNYDVGVLQTGIFTFPVHFIPPGAESYRSYGLCNSSQFDEMNGMLVPDLHVFAYLLHTHLSGRGVKAAQYRNGEQLRIICEDNNYDFRLQEIRDMKEILIIKPGDEILVECNFQTLDRSGVTFGGPSTMNEMCLTFLFYYPRNNISSCMGYPDILYIAHVLKQEASDAVEGMMAMDFVDWDNDTVKIAEKAAKEANQVVMIKNINELQRSESGLIRDISIPEQAACHNISGQLSLSGLRATANLHLTSVCTSESSATTEIASLPLISLTHLVFACLILASDYGK